MCVVYNATEKREPNGSDVIILPELYKELLRVVCHVKGACYFTYTRHSITPRRVALDPPLVWMNFFAAVRYATKTTKNQSIFLNVFVNIGRFS
jgi:hypothetical protein